MGPGQHQLAVDHEHLESIVRRVLESETATLEGWELAGLGGGIGPLWGGGKPARFSGTASDRGRRRRWSVVLKTLQPPPGEVFLTGQFEPGHQFYWKREALVYSSRLLDGLPGGFRAAGCYGIDEEPDALRLWLEDVDEPSGAHWQRSRFAEAARHIGRFNGIYLAGRPVPDDAWLCRDLLRPRIQIAAQLWDRLTEIRDRPLIRHGWPGDLLDRGHVLWLKKESLLNALDDVPRVFCHGDAERRNLFANDDNDAHETIAIDWAQPGPRALGTDPAALVAQSITLARAVDPSEIVALSDAVWAGYGTGLGDVGCTAVEEARLGYALTLTLQHLVLAGGIIVALDTKEQRPLAEAAFGATLEVMLDRYVAIQPHILELAQEAMSWLGI